MIDPQDFKATVGRFATGVTVVTTASPSMLHGMTANAFTSVSLDPPLVLVCVARRAWMHDLLLSAGSFAVNILAEDQAATATWFARPDRPFGAEQFARVGWRPASRSRAPLLDGAVAHLDCDVHEALPGGDHSVVLGEVTRLDRPVDAPPLLYYEGRYGRWDPTPA